MDQFDWFKEFFIGFITNSLASYIERLRPSNTNVELNCVFVHQEVLRFVSCGPLHKLSLDWYIER